jgi:deazaflavin-dependent oxidoreductase (nitroreductase family)
MASFKDRIRQFNKRYLNRVLGKLTQARSGSFAMVHHRGRKSGTAYQTPIMAFPQDDGFLIALTYGPHVDWYRNLLAAGQGSLHWHRQDFEIQAVKALDGEAALPRFPQPQRFALGLMKVGDFVHLDTEPAPRASGEEAR